jgi:hypothetical protein
MNPRLVADIIGESLAHMTRSRRATSPTAVAELSRVFSCDFKTDFVKCPETAEALAVFQRWVLQNDESIQGLCFYGSLAADACRQQTAILPKEGGEYISTSVLIGPSDVDAVVVLSSATTTLPKVQSDFVMVDSSARATGRRALDLLDGVTLLQENDLRVTLERDGRLLPMYWRMTTQGGYWARPCRRFHHELKAAATRTNLDSSELERQSRAFYWRRIDAMLSFYRLLLSNLVCEGWMYAACERVLEVQD